MARTMEDLRIEVASRLRNALHGREIDKTETEVNLPHMLGITPLGKIHDPTNEGMSLLDPQHNFWSDYYEEANTRNAVAEEIQTAIKTLRADNTFRIMHPYGEDAEIVYIEVDQLTSAESQLAYETGCAECGSTIETSLNLAQSDGYYSLVAYLDCDNCDMSRIVETPMRRR